MVNNGKAKLYLVVYVYPCCMYVSGRFSGFISLRSPWSRFTTRPIHHPKPGIPDLMKAWQNYNVKTNRGMNTLLFNLLAKHVKSRKSKS